MTRSPVPDATLVQARIHPRALDHMSRYFDATAASVFVELIQNARRAGASHVDIVADSADTDAPDDPTIVTVWDNGRGITDPAVLLSFGESDWDGDLARTERAAGMGIACLARRGCTVSSRPRTESSQSIGGWRMTLERDHFLGKSAATAVPDPAAPTPCGTCVTFRAAESPDALTEAAAHAARYAPLSVSFNGRELDRLDFLQGAIRTECWEGLTLAVIPSSSLRNTSPDLNFHGLPVNLRLPYVDTLNGAIWTVRAEAGDCPQLELVLPARRQAVENDFLARLREEARLAIYRALAPMDPPPPLAFEDRARAAAAGIELPEAPAELRPWVPPTAEAEASDDPPIGLFRPVAPDALVVEYEAHPPAAQPFCRAARRAHLAPRLFAADRRLAGYGWYDRLPRLTGVTAHIDIDGHTHTQETLQQRFREARGKGAPFGPRDRVERIVMTVDLSGADGTRSSTPYPADVVFLDARSGWLSDAQPMIAADSDIDAEDLARLLRHAYFRPHVDIDADSYATQLKQFDTEALLLALKHAASADEATRAVIARAVFNDIHWLLPRDRAVNIAVHGDDVLVKLGPPGATPRKPKPSLVFALPPNRSDR